MNIRRFAVVGDPVAHSKSPVMHAAALRALGLPHRYEAVRATAEELPLVVAQLKDGALDGLNITVPHKQRVLSLVDVVDESARLAGAANTLVRRDDGQIVAYNTDAPALAAELDLLSAGSLPWEKLRALVLGSGGAARAAVAALGRHLRVRDVVVRARAFAGVDARTAFAASVPCPVACQPWEPSPSSERETLVLVQATSAGMLGADNGEEVCAALAWESVPRDAIALDVVYAPTDTPWIRAARARSLRADAGLGMLARQGALALELWLGPGIEAPLETMRAALGAP